MANQNKNSLPSKMIVEISSDESHRSIDWSSDDWSSCDDWSSNDEVEICSLAAPVSGHVPEFTPLNRKASSSGSKLSDRFLEMGFPSRAVFKAIEDHGEDDHEEPVINTILTYMALEKLPDDINHASNVPHSSESSRANHVDLSNVDNIWESEAMKSLQHMGYPNDQAFRAIETRGLETPIADLVDFIEGLNNDVGPQRKHKKQRVAGHTRLKTNRTRRKAMVGFGVPGITMVSKNIPTRGGRNGFPYFYFENVARAPKKVWETMSRSLYEIEPEFVDSIHFCAAARKRGYIHNLPIDNRFPILPLPPSTIQEALPSTNNWWPKWDDRTKLNCICINQGSAKDIRKIKEKLDSSGSDPPKHIWKNVLEQCKRYNFVWVGKNKVASLEPKEIEEIMGYPINHTSGVSTTARYKCLGNTFQVDTVGYHLSVLKKLFPDGIKVLSLFSGIGGAEVAIHKLGIPLKFVVSVESSEACWNILQSWWQQTNQQGELIHISDVKYVTLHKLKELMEMSGGFDLVIGGSPCNNFSGNNRASRYGLEGSHSSLFFDYCRILELVKSITLDRIPN